MRHMRSTLIVLLLFVCVISLPADDKQNFDGNWQTTLSCPNFRDALGYSYQFVSTVKNGVLHGIHGTEGQPSSLTLDGTISPDGKASLYAKGRTGSKEYVPGRDTPKNTEYGYNIAAQFQDTNGTGARAEGRPCTLKFVKE